MPHIQHGLQPLRGRVVSERSVEEVKDANGETPAMISARHCVDAASMAKSQAERELKGATTAWIHARRAYAKAARDAGYHMPDYLISEVFPHG